jgi:fructose-bisphosphate aldolase class II
VLASPTQARAILALAARERFALLAVNADSPACVQDALDAAKEAQAPIIVETSLWQLKGRSFGAGDPVRGLARYLAQAAITADDPAYAAVPVLVHTDHIKGPETLPILTAAIAGVRLREAALRASTISLDSSAMSEDENIATMRRLCAFAAERGLDLTLEMEAGVDDGITEPRATEHLLGSVERAHPGYLALYAPGVGTRHGFSAGGFPTFSPDAIAQQRVLAERICGRAIGIALHGSSGLSADDLQRGVGAGVTKVNWSSESLLIRARAVAAYYAANADSLDPLAKTFKATAMDDGVQGAVSRAYVPEVVARLRTLGSAGRAAACLAAAGSAQPSAMRGATR